MPILIRSDVRLPDLDHTEPVFPTGGTCPKRRGCKGPRTVQGEGCPRCGVWFGEGKAVA
jgi:hypothetical protein